MPHTSLKQEKLQRLERGSFQIDFQSRTRNSHSRVNGYHGLALRYYLLLRAREHQTSNSLT